MHGLARPRTRIDDAPVDPAQVCYRRAVGLEVEIRPEQSFARGAMGPRAGELESLMRSDLEPLLAWNAWRTAAEAGVSPEWAWRQVQADRLFYARHRPEGELSGRPGALAQVEQAPKTPLRLRDGVWMVPAVENALAVAPIPFMPRGRDLAASRLVGARFATLERGHEVLGVSFVGSEKTGRALRTMVPYLDGGTAGGPWIRSLDPFSRKVLAWMDRAGLLEAAPTARLPEPVGPYAAWLGHAAVLLRLGRARILVDPLFFAPTGAGEPFDPRALPPLDAIVITHGDNDHLNPHSLARLPTHVPVIVPRVGPEPEAFQVDMEGLLRLLGFEHVHPVEDGDVVQIGDVQVEALPFEGEDWGLDLAKQTFSIQGPDGVVFLGADAAAMPELYDALGARSRPVDLAFLGVSGNAETLVMPEGFGYGNFYEPWIPRARRNEWVQHCAGPADAADAAARMKPRFAFGYACGGAEYIRTEYGDVGSHRQMAERIIARELSTRPVSMPLGVPVALSDLDGLEPW